jgi:hypothetical protein
MGRGRSREAAPGSARAGPLGSGGGPRTPGSAPGEPGGALGQQLLFTGVGGGPGGRCPGVGCDRGGRRRVAALVSCRGAVGLLCSGLLRGDAVGGRGASSHTRLCLLWAGMRGESWCAGGARVGARRRGIGVSDSRTITEYSIGPHVMQAVAAQLRGRPHGMLRTRVVLDRTDVWTPLGVHVSRGLQP